MSGFHDKLAVVTGTTSGIGEAIVRRLAHAGAHVCLLARDQRKLDALRESLGASTTVHTDVADLADRNDVEALAKRLQSSFNGVDILVHSAGLLHFGTIGATPAEVLDRHYQINVRAPYCLTRALLPALRARRGQVVFLNSSVVWQPVHADLACYTATKHAMKALADALRAEVNEDGIRVLSVYPGRTATPMQARVYVRENRSYAPEKLLQPEEIADVVLNALQLPASAEVTDISIRPMRRS